MEQEVVYQEVQENPAEVKAPENVFLGVIGALIGAILGGASIILLSEMGYVASISGVILAFCTLKGYELLAKGLSKKGMVICIVVMLVTPFLADLLGWGIVIQRDLPELGAGLLEAMLLVPALIEAEVIVLSDYLMNLGMVYLFVILGGFYTAKNFIKK